MRAVTSTDDDYAIRLTADLLAGDLRAAESTVRESNLGGTLVLDQLIAPAMFEVGERWARDEISTAEEHLACTTAHRLLVDLAPTFVRAPADSRELILLASARLERHTLGMTMAATVLRGAGFEVQIIEGGVPHDDLIAFARAREPKIIGISIGMPNVDDVVDLYERLVEQDPGVGILFGGRTADTVVAELARTDPLVRVATGASDARVLVEELLALRGTAAAARRRTAELRS